jgi:hypothetical protein
MSYSNRNTQYGGIQKITTWSALIPSHLFTPTADQKFQLGSIWELPDGRMFRYCKDSGTGITKAFMACAEPPDAQAFGTVQTAYGVSAGEQKFDILCTTGNGITDHELVDGYLWVNATGTAEGDLYIIKDNYWITGDTVMMVEIADEGGVRTAIAATDDITFQPNLCRNVKLNPTAQDACVVGVPLATVTAGYYFWAQYRGICPLQIDASDTVVVGEPIGKAGTAGTAGAGGLIANDGTDATWGTVVVVAGGGEVALVNLMLP